MKNSDQDFGSQPSLSREELNSWIRQTHNVLRERSMITRRRANQNVVPLSFAQQGIWMDEQMADWSSLHNAPRAFRIKGPLDIRKLEWAFNKIVKRHEILRTTFRTQAEEPVQVIGPFRPVRLRVLNLKETSQQDDADLLKMLIRESTIPFDITLGPLLRICLFRVQEHDHVLFFNLHRIVSDAKSTAILIHELSVLYSTPQSAHESALVNLPCQYADFALWQRRSFRGQRLKSLLSYWKDQLRSLPPPLKLPMENTCRIQHSQGTVSQAIMISEKLTKALNDLSRREGATVFMTLLASFKVLIHRYTGQEDLAIGIPIANRTQVETENLMGSFLNTLVMRSDLSGNPSFLRLLARVKEIALGAYDHVDLPFEKLVEELRPDRKVNSNPLFDIVFDFINTPPSQLYLDQLDVTDIGIPKSQLRPSTTLFVSEEVGKLKLEICYRTEMFSDKRARSILYQFKNLLEQILLSPETLISNYSLIGPGADSVLPNPRLPLNQTRHELVTDRIRVMANAAPKQVAVRQDTQLLTYEQLIERADVVTNALILEGVQPGDVVAIMGKRSQGLITCIVAALQSGAIILMIDKQLPSRRRQLMIEQAQAKYVVLVDHELRREALVAEFMGLTTLWVDPDNGKVASRSQALDSKVMARPLLAPDDPCYIFFTSGTTGIPKAILGNQKGISHFLEWQRDTFQIESKDRCAQLTGLSFDVILRDLFLPLTSGATLCLPPGDPDYFASDQVIPWLESERITLLHTVPTLAESWLNSDLGSQSLRYMRAVFFAGEPLSHSLVERWRQAFPDSGEIINLYGPTETTLAKCSYRVPRPATRGVQPIGWSIPGSQTLVLSGPAKLCGIGELGEIVIRSPFRTKGYINAPSEDWRFFPNPFREDESDLLFHTGDLGRYQTDGSVQIVGRLDNQVKIGGVRVEPTEVSSVLSQHSSVTSSVVVPRTDEQGQSYLSAFVVTPSKRHSTKEELRAFLANQLPSPMIPRSITLLDYMPLTANGKVDLPSLPQLEELQVDPATLVGPRTQTEQEIARVWRELLHCGEIGSQDNFFALGGHSLLAVQAISRIRKRFQVDIGLRTLFDRPTIADLAKAIDKAQKSEKKGPAQNMKTL